MELLVANRLKCSEPDVQRYICDSGAGSTARVQDLRREVQARGGRGDRTRFAREYGLVTIAIFGSVRAFNLRRQRDMADLVQPCKDVFVRSKVYRSLAVLAASDDLGLQTIELNALARA